MDTKLITESCKQLDNINTVRSRIVQDGLSTFGELSYLMSENLQQEIIAAVKIELSKEGIKLEDVIKKATK